MTAAMYPGLGRCPPPLVTKPLPVTSPLPLILANIIINLQKGSRRIFQLLPRRPDGFMQSLGSFFACKCYKREVQIKSDVFSQVLKVTLWANFSSLTVAGHLFVGRQHQLELLKSHTATVLLRQKNTSCNEHTGARGRRSRDSLHWGS